MGAKQRQEGQSSSLDPHGNRVNKNNKQQYKVSKCRLPKTWDNEEGRGTKIIRYSIRSARSDKL
jgi:hypothetical protein